MLHTPSSITDATHSQQLREPWSDKRKILWENKNFWSSCDEIFSISMPYPLQMLRLRTTVRRTGNTVHIKVRIFFHQAPHLQTIFKAIATLYQYTSYISPTATTVSVHCFTVARIYAWTHGTVFPHHVLRCVLLASVVNTRTIIFIYRHSFFIQCSV
jgi:hypothetical protein